MASVYHLPRGNKLKGRIIIALDFETKSQVIKLLDQLAGEISYVKVGMQLFYSEGPTIVNYLIERNLKVFLDLKLHDIPNTVMGGVASLASLGSSMINVHALGGVSMMEKARLGLETIPSSSRPLLIGVTQLTSSSREMINNELKIQGKVNSSVLHLASMAERAGLDGVVCSPIEVKLLRKKMGDDFLLVTPGVRLKASLDDQKRVATPREAFDAGADYIVVGREVTRSSDPIGAFKEIVNECENER